MSTSTFPQCVGTYYITDCFNEKYKCIERNIITTRRAHSKFPDCKNIFNSLMMMTIVV